MSKNYRKYWQKNKLYLFILLSIWFAVSYIAGIFYADELNRFRIGGFKLGFWIAQQGAIYVYVGLIFTYVLLMNKLDKSHNLEEE